MRIDITGLDFKNYSYEYELFRNEDQLGKWISAGHNIENTKIGVKQISNTSSFDNIKNQFPHIKNIGICFHVLQPGNYLPEHRDQYSFFAKLHKIECLNDIERSVVFLEDHKSGHFLTVGNKVYSKWKAGDYVSWKGTTPHSAINLGVDSRYTLQITGLVC